VSWADAPARAGRVGLQEFGLPYVADPAILKHLAQFLRRRGEEEAAAEGRASGGGPAHADAILFNGGALAPEVVRRRIVEVVSSWQGADAPPRVLLNPSLDLAVARGAAYYGVVRRGGGIRIGGGTARSFYIGLETHDPARPWLCVVPRDAQEGAEISITGHDFDLLTGQPILFPLASSSVRPDDRPGDLVQGDPDTMLTLPPLESLIRVGRKAKAERASVNLAARVTEVGTIELWCQSRTDDRRWKLQFQMRSAASSGGEPPTDQGAEGQVVIEQSILDQAIAAVRETFTLPATSPDHAPARLVKRLEERLESPRESWPPSVLRALWDPLREHADGRLASPSHELRWFNLTGYVLRPGVGFPRDEIRIKALWSLYHQGVKHQKDVQCWAEWWILWRRVAAGLQRVHHEELERRLTPYLIPAKGSSPAKKSGRPRPEPHELAEMWRCAAALERASLAAKQAYGDALLQGRSTAPPAVVLWCLGRLGAREPLIASAESALARSVAERWLEALLERSFTPGRETADAIFALSELARATGDRARDIGPELRERVLKRLQELGATESALAPVREYQERARAEQAAALGDALPIGLRLVKTDAP